MKERYMNKQEGKNKGRIAVVERRDEVGKTVVLMFEDGNGGTKVSYSTLKRWWKKVEDDAVEETVNEEVVPEVEQEQEVASDGTPYTEVMQEIIEDGQVAANTVKEKKVRKKREKKEVIPYDTLLNKVQVVIEATGYGIKIANTLPRFIAIINSSGKQKYALYLGNKKCVVSMPESKIPEGKSPDRVRNCVMAAAFDVSYDNLDTIKELVIKEEK